MKYVVALLGAIISAGAQITLKISSGHRNWSRGWFLFLLLSGALYGISLLVYLYLLRQFPISRIYPATVLLVILFVTLYGLLAGERLSAPHVIGIVLAAGSVVLLMT